MKCAAVIILFVLGLGAGCSPVESTLIAAPAPLTEAPEREKPPAEQDSALKKTMPQENTALPELSKPRLVVKKAARQLQVFDGRKLIRTYAVALGFAPKGDKRREGDGKTPEGEFYVFTKNDRSNYYLSLGLSYPSAKAAARGVAEKLISGEEQAAILGALRDKKMPPQKTRLGGEIYIHGGGIGKDWTWGCVALKNSEMKELFEAIPVGTRVTILD
jgi:murein L,D-transpeptidase YafK